MKVTILTNGGDFEGQYRRSDQILDAKYHRYPTNINFSPVSDRESIEIASYDSLANQIVARSHAEGGTPIGKLIL